MSTYDERMNVARMHEEAVRARFVITGWRADAFGQAQLPESCRAVLKRWKDEDGNPSLIRWLPDLIVYTETIPPRVALVDAKGEISRTTNHAVEIASITCDKFLSEQLNTPTYYVFSDFGVLTPQEVLDCGWKGSPPRNGSGTPYYVVPKSRCHDFCHVFPPLSDQSLEVAP